MEIDAGGGIVVDGTHTRVPHIWAAGDVTPPQPSDEASAENKPAPQPPHGRSLLPTAAMLSALVVLGLALRRRRRATLEHQAAKPGRPAR